MNRHPAVFAAARAQAAGHGLFAVRNAQVVATGDEYRIQSAVIFADLITLPQYSSSLRV
jgi:hypothetical protein